MGFSSSSFWDRSDRKFTNTDEVSKKKANTNKIQKEDKKAPSNSGRVVVVVFRLLLTSFPESSNSQSPPAKVTCLASSSSLLLLRLLHFSVEEKVEKSIPPMKYFSGTLVLRIIMTMNNNNHNNVQAETTAVPSVALAHQKRLTMATISASLKRMEYAVRGTVVIEADKMASKGTKIIYTNIGNPQSLGQQPLTWPRQVIALANLPRPIGIDHPNVQSLFPIDAIARAREILDATGSVGAYSHSQGVPLLRQDVADFITKRDGAEQVPTNPDDIFLTNGASAAIQMVLTALIAQPERTGISTYYDSVV
jgi:Aminotransferase class I and II